MIVPRCRCSFRSRRWIFGNPWLNFGKRDHQSAQSMPERIHDTRRCAMEQLDSTRGSGSLTLSTRRAFLQVGYSGLLGLGLPGLLAARSAAPTGTGRSVGRAEAVIGILVSG